MRNYNRLAVNTFERWMPTWGSEHTFGSKIQITVPIQPLIYFYANGHLGASVTDVYSLVVTQPQLVQPVPLNYITAHDMS